MIYHRIRNYSTPEERLVFTDFTVIDSEECPRPLGSNEIHTTLDRKDFSDDLVDELKWSSDVVSFPPKTLRFYR